MVDEESLQMENARRMDHITPVRPKERFIVFGAPAIEEAEIAEGGEDVDNDALEAGEKPDLL